MDEIYTVQFPRFAEACRIFGYYDNLNIVENIAYMSTTKISDGTIIGAFDKDREFLYFVVCTGTPGSNDIAFIDDPDRYVKKPLDISD